MEKYKLDNPNNNEWLTLANELIERFKDVTPENYATKLSLHHIKLRSMYPELTNDPKNHLWLPIREHWLLHYYMWKADGRYAMAFWFCYVYFKKHDNWTITEEEERQLKADCSKYRTREKNKMSIVKQIGPNHADHINCYRDDYLKQMFDNEPVIAQPKYDGERMLIHFDGKQVYCTSRRISKKTGEFMRNEDRLPHLTNAYQQSNLYGMQYTVLDCECYGRNWSEAASVLHSLPERAAELLKTINIKFAVFDCLFYKGIDLRDRLYLERLHYAIEVVNDFNWPQLHTVKFLNADLQPDVVENVELIHSKDEAFKCMDNAIAAGFEGVVVKSLDRKYYDKAASLKCKKFETVDVVVYGYQPGNGKYSNTVGALLVGYYDPDKDEVVHVAKVNCGTDEDRDMWRDNWIDLKYSVIEVKCQEITGRSLRHPVYIRLRQDKNAKECTKETIFKEEV